MSLMISIDDELAKRLKYQASALSLSVDQWAAEVLNDGFALDARSDRWKRLNARRLELIQRDHDAGLTATEMSELAALQHLTAKAMVTSDLPMLRKLEEFEARACVTDE